MDTREEAMKQIAELLRDQGLETYVVVEEILNKVYWSGYDRGYEDAYG